jgi:hypothetical protein
LLKVEAFEGNGAVAEGGGGLDGLESGGEGGGLEGGGLQGEGEVAREALGEQGQGEGDFGVEFGKGRGEVEGRGARRVGAELKGGDGRAGLKGNGACDLGGAAGGFESEERGEFGEVLGLGVEGEGARGGGEGLEGAGQGDFA